MNILEQKSQCDNIYHLICLKHIMRLVVDGSYDLKNNVVKIHNLNSAMIISQVNEDRNGKE